MVIDVITQTDLQKLLLNLVTENIMNCIKIALSFEMEGFCLPGDYVRSKEAHSLAIEHLEERL